MARLFLLTGLWLCVLGVTVAVFPPPCSRIECPSYDLIGSGKGYEIRRYNSTVWISTAAIEDISLVDATRTGFLLLFDYIQGNNEYKRKIEMTAPVLTQVKPSDGPFCKSSFVVSFYVPKKNQADPPPPNAQLHLQKWLPTYAAVRQFGGFVHDADVGVEAAALKASLEGSTWYEAVEKSRSGAYAVAQYNSPFEFDHRVNEIWMPSTMDNTAVLYA
uniref:SOUL heme-binding protein n=1 Tax=Kalanchoe fedtschenkoi TaxID=63787 RepID=A0A7N0TPU9_KALFE